LGVPNSKLYPCGWSFFSIWMISAVHGGRFSHKGCSINRN